MEPEESTTTTQTQLSSIIKGLASCNPTLRSQSLKSLLSWLPTQSNISDDLMKKLWKSLFYCLWHCDKITNQTQLINHLSSLLPSLPTHISLSYFTLFFTTMRREWSGIDHLRLDKFYLLIRSFVRSLFVLMRNCKWDSSLLGKFVGVLEKGVIFVENDGEEKGLCYGVTYHVVSVFCEELKPFLPLKREILEVLLKPFVGVMGRSGNKVLVGKVKSCVFDCLVKNGKFLLGVRRSDFEVDERDERVLFGNMALGMGFGAMFYELGSSSDCVQGNRKVVFGLHEEFSRLEKEKTALGIEILFNEIEVVDDEGLVNSINDENVDGVLDKKSMKKKNKKKKNNGIVTDANNGDSEMVNSYNEVSSGQQEEDVIDELVLNETVISNLQKQFERIAAESGFGVGGLSALESPLKVDTNDNGKASKKKRKRSKALVNGENNGIEGGGEQEDGPKTEGKSGKRVKFSMKNNLVWKPHSPLPPQNLRLPPSVAPRGSALKKGLSPGPIRDSNQEGKKAKKKKASPLKKARKVKTISPAAKRIKKVKLMSA